MKNKVTVIIPIFNERENIWLMIDDIFAEYNCNILVIDDFSTDWSDILLYDIQKKYWEELWFIEKKEWIDSKWLTDSIIKWISTTTTEYFIVMDWDFQHPISKIKDFISFFESWNDIVIWQRSKIVFKEKKYRELVSKIWNFLINLKIRKNGFYLKDPLSWFFWGKSVIFVWQIENNRKSFIKSGYKFLFEFLKTINVNDYRVVFFDFNFCKRKFWKSKISIKIYIDFIKWLLK